MASKRSRKARRRPASSSERPPADGSSVGTILPASIGGESSSSSSSGDDAPGAVPPLPPDSAAEGGDDGAAAGAGADSSDRLEDAERKRQERVLVLRMIFGGVFLALPPQHGGGELGEAESAMLADAWELPLRPYWDSMMGPWAGALLTTVAIMAPRVIAARAKLAAAGVSPGSQVG